MSNYKIVVNDKYERKEAQDLFVQLGFNDDFRIYQYPCYLATWNGDFSDYKIGCLDTRRERKEITLPQLRDLVVLHRNDVKDATHKGERENLALLCSDGAEYFWNYSTKKWFKPAIMTFEDKNMKPIQSEAEQGLISGADALRALVDGKEVEFKCGGSDWRLLNAKQQPLEILIDPTVQFCLKPCTIKLSIEIPEPFEPKEGEAYWVLNPYCDKGYCEERYTKEYTTLGAWRSEEEIRKVVAAFRGGIKG